MNRILFKKKKKYTNQEKREYLYETVVRQNRESKSRILGVFDCLFFFRSYVQLFKTHFKEKVYFSITFFFFLNRNLNTLLIKSFSNENMFTYFYQIPLKKEKF